MDMRIENRDAFCLCGYAMETSEETLEKDCATMRQQHEDKLRAISPNLYFVAWMSENGKMIYQLSVETPGDTPAGMTRVEVPAAQFAVGTVPQGESVLGAWHKFFETVEPTLGVAIDVEYPFHFEYFDDNGVCEVWSPVVKASM